MTSGANAKDLIEHDKDCRILAATKMQEISRRFLQGKGIERFRNMQEDLLRNADVLVAAGVMSYDKVIEKITQLEDHIDEHGGNDNVKTDPQERVRDWLNGSDEDVVSNIVGVDGVGSVN